MESGTSTEGDELGLSDGLLDALLPIDGEDDVLALGDPDADPEGLADGDPDSLAEGDAEGEEDSLAEGDPEGDPLALADGLPLAEVDGDALGLADALLFSDGEADGLPDGEADSDAPVASVSNVPVSDQSVQLGLGDGEDDGDPASSIVNVGDPTIDAYPSTAVAGTVTVIVSCAVMLNSGAAGSVIVTTVSEVLTTADRGKASLTSAFQPVASFRLEVSPSMMSWRIPSNANSAEGDALALELGDPEGEVDALADGDPEGEVDGDADALLPGLGDDDGLLLGLPDALADGDALALAEGLDPASCVIVTVGEATIALDPSTAAEGTVTVRTSWAVIEYADRAGRVIVTMVSLVRTTAVTGMLANWPFHPHGSDCAETIPSRMS